MSKKMSDLYMEDTLSLFEPGLDFSSDDNVLDQPPLSIPLSPESQTRMTKSILDIFELEEEPPSNDVEMEEDGGDDPVLDLEDQRKKTDSLRAILPAVAQLWWSDSDQIDLVAEKLGDGSRNPKWRIPLGESGTLDFFLDILKRYTLRYTLKIHVLRLIGNSCADTDENRARVVNSDCLSSVILQLKDTSLLAFVIPVLYNICIDYEPAQQLASKSFLSREIVEVILSPAFGDSRAFLGYACKLLDLMIAQASEPEVASDQTAIVLLNIAADRELHTDMDDFIALVNTALAYLQYEKFQKALIVQGAVDTTLTVLVDSYTRFDSHPAIGSSEPDEDDAKALSQMRSNLNQVLSDISALPEFKEAYPVISPLTSSLRRWLLSPQLQLQVCACIMLGNLARSDRACEEFVHTSQVHKPLISVLSEANDSQLLHAVLGFLKNLALPIQNKEALGAAGLFDVMPRLWALDTLQQIQFSSISLARQLTVGTFDNVRKICKRLSEDEDSPANTRTYLSLLIALFDRTDVVPIKMEISRLITSVCRVVNSYTGRSSEEMERIRIKFFKMHPDIGRPLSFMVSQDKWPVLRSEGWFVFALIARFPEGAQCISDLMHDVAVFQPLVEMLTGKRIVDYQPSSPSPSTSPITTPPSVTSDTAGVLNFETHTPESVNPQSQAAELLRIDRENALVLVSELLKNRGNDMAVMRRALFEDLLKGGTEIMLTYKETKPLYGETLVLQDNRVRAGSNLQQVVAKSTVDLSS